MTAERVMTNADIVAGAERFLGTVVVKDGMIAAVEPGLSDAPGAIDCAGDHLFPGLVEIHTDNLERQFQPRPSVRWPADAAMLAHDTQMVSAGITTVCDAVCVGFYGGKRERLEFLQTSLEALREAEAAGALKAEHLLHLRCEVSDPHVLELFEPLAGEPHLKVVSFMDHTPGQRQWHDLEKYRTFHRGRTNASADDFDAMIERRIGEQERYAHKHRQGLLQLLTDASVVLASHDDTTAEHVAEAAADGFTVSEFPTTLKAAEAAHAAGMAIVMGGPNVILGGSHSGNVAAADLAAVGLLDVLSSDYVPVSLLHAAFRLTDLQALDLPSAVALISANPARILGFDDRGVIAPGRRADLIRVRRGGDVPAVLAVWREGERVA